MNKKTKKEALKFLTTLIDDESIIAHSVEVSNVSLDICEALNIQGEQRDLICIAQLFYMI